MIRKKKEAEVRQWCSENGFEPLSIKGDYYKNGKSVIKISLKCEKCGTRYDRDWNNLKKQKFPHCCTSCAHTEIQNERRLNAQKVVDLFAKYGYKVLTPTDRIKPVGKRNLYNFAKVDIEDRFGVVRNICWNTFQSKLQYYIDLNEGGHCSAELTKPSSLEQKVIDFLDENEIPYKREFKFSGCRNKCMLRFDFCLFYDTENRILIEVDGERHYKSLFKDLQHNDEIKNYYCTTNNIPLLRIPYWEFKTDDYKKSIQNFINTNKV